MRDLGLPIELWALFSTPFASFVHAVVTRDNAITTMCFFCMLYSFRRTLIFHHKVRFPFSAQDAAASLLRAAVAAFRCARFPESRHRQTPASTTPPGGRWLSV